MGVTTPEPEKETRSTTVMLPDNIRRGLRTVLQVAAALVVTGVVDQFIWDLLDSQDVASESSIRVIVGFCLVFLTTWAMNFAEDKTGVSILSPRDRTIGDQELKSGLGHINPAAGSTSAG